MFPLTRVPFWSFEPQPLVESASNAQASLLCFTFLFARSTVQEAVFATSVHLPTRLPGC